MDTFSLLNDFDVRKEGCGVDDTTCEILRQSWPIVRQSIPIAVQALLRKTSKISRVAPIILEHKDEIFKFLTSHFEVLFRADFGRAYVESCVATAVAERAIGLGARSRVVAANYLLENLIFKFSRKSFLATKSSRFNSAFMKPLFFDVANTMIVHEDLAKKAAAERNTNINQAISKFGQSIGGVVTAIKEGSSSLLQASDVMEELSSATQRSMRAAATVSSETTSAIRTTATATGQISASIQSVREQTNHSLAVANSAVEGTEKTRQSIELLAEAASKIGSIVGVISEVASQTNLLALNATIEAARVGSAGKGFAVVASEVKALAAQTSRATEDISSQIDNIQKATARSVREMSAISEIINELMKLTSSRAIAVQEQESATEEIVASMHSAVSITEYAEREMRGLEKVSDDGLCASKNVLNLTKLLSQGAIQLEESVEEFFARVRAVQ